MATIEIKISYAEARNMRSNKDLLKILEAHHIDITKRFSYVDDYAQQSYIVIGQVDEMWGDTPTIPI